MSLFLAYNLRISYKLLMSGNDVFALYPCTEKNEYVCVWGGGGGGGG